MLRQSIFRRSTAHSLTRRLHPYSPTSIRSRNDARSALLAEIQQRGLAASQLQKLHSVELRHEAQFDRLERLRRKRMVLTRLGHHSLKGWIFVIVGAALLALIELLIFPNH